MATAFRPDKPQPIFADFVLSMDSDWFKSQRLMLGDPELPSLSQRVRSSQKFVITEEAYERIKTAMESDPEQLVYNAKFALPPHELTWLEMGYPDATIGGIRANTAYLIDHNKIYVFAAQENEEGVSMIPIITELHRPSTREDQMKLMATLGMGGQNIDRAYWGQLYDQVPEKLRHRMREQHTTWVTTNMLTPEHWQQVSDGLDFHVRIVLATLLAFNQPKSVLNITAMDAQRRMTAKGPKRYMAHNVVTMQLGKKTNIRFNYRVPGGTHAGPRWHEVMGHWMHFPTDQGRNCHHGYGQDPDWWEPFTKEEDDGRLRYQCRQCGSKRVWREYPEGRGDGSKGMSLHHHVVQG